MGLVAAVMEWYFRYDELAAAQPTEQAFEYTHGRVHLRLACRSGCNHCCVSPVSVIGPEVVLIAEYIRARFTEVAIEALVARIQERRAIVGTAQDREVMCPLNVDGKCSVYEVRPINCRMWHSFDEAACRRAFLAGDKTTHIPRASTRADESGLVRCSAASVFSSLGIDRTDLDFIPALEIALTTGDVVSRFLRGERLFARVKREQSHP